MGKKKKFKAKYKCTNCTMEWKAAPGPVICPACNNKYVEWLTYDETYGTLSLEQLKRIIK